MTPHVPRRQTGVSLVEMLVSLAVVAMLATAAWPLLGDMLAQQRASHAADRLATSLALARTAAASRRTEVRLDVLDGASTFDAGWRLTAVSGQVDDAVPPFSVVSLRDSCLRITLRATSSGTSSLRLTAVGYSRSERGGFFAATFEVRCGTAVRQVRLGAQGRIRVCRPGVDTGCD